VPVTEVGVVDTGYGVSQLVASRRLNAGWLTTVTADGQRDSDLRARSAIKAKLHYAIWFEAGLKLVADLQRDEIWPISLLAAN